MMESDDVCRWMYRAGFNKNTHFGYPTCSPDRRIYLSKITSGEIPRIGVAEVYEGCLCPICNKKITVDYSNL